MSRPTVPGEFESATGGSSTLVLFGAAGWIAASALPGTAFAMFNRDIKNKLLRSLCENMTSDESALAVQKE